MPIDYETLRVIWWLLLGVLLIGFAITGGFDMGVAMWLPFLTKNDNEKRIAINTIGPTWEGNQVWFILGGGAIFAAWPTLYAVSFSGFYLAMLVVLLALILRPVAFKYRSKLESPLWRSVWDLCLFIGGFVPSLIFGVAVGNVLLGVPFHFDPSMRSFYTGSFLELLSPFALLSGLLSVSMLAMHGANFLAIKTEGDIEKRAKLAARFSSFLTFVLFILAGLWAAKLQGYKLVTEVSHSGPSNPLHKEVIMYAGAWMQNYKLYPYFMAAPIIAIFGSLISFLFAKSFSKLAFVNSAISIFGVISTVGLSMFPFILPSSTHPGQSLMVWDSSSSQLTLFIMLIATVIFMPIILTYTAWVYRILKGKITLKTIFDNNETMY